MKLSEKQKKGLGFGVLGIIAVVVIIVIVELVGSSTVTIISKQGEAPNIRQQGEQQEAEKRKETL